VIRLATVADEPELLRLIEEFNDVDGHRYDEERVRQALLPLLTDDKLGVVYVWGQPIEGYCVATWSYSLESGGRDGLIDELYTRQRRRGVGAAAFTAVLADLKRRGIPRLFLETEATNEQVRRFYRRHGFVAEDSVWMSLEL
jgi:ribosomal protein S18 acetylase RimI-like enzyme